MPRKLSTALALAVVCLLSGIADIADAATCGPLPNQITNGTLADASKVMGDFNALLGCLNSGQLAIPSVSSLPITNSGGGTATIQLPSGTTAYNFNLPAGAGTAGQVLTSNGGGSTATSWTSLPASSLPPPIVDGIPVGRPAAASLSWVNQGPASFTEYANGPITISIPPTAGGAEYLRGLGQTPPSPPYTMTAKIDTLMWNSSYFKSGIYIIDSTGKLNLLLYQISGSNSISVERRNSTNSFNSTSWTVGVSPSRTWWFRINNDGTNWNFSVSHNGADWISVYSESLSAWLGPTITSLGVFGEISSSITQNEFVSIWSFELKSGSGTNSSWQTH